MNFEEYKDTLEKLFLNLMLKKNMLSVVIHLMIGNTFTKF